MVKRDDLLRFVDDRARGEASRRGLDEYGTEDLIDEAKAIVDGFFEGLIWETVENGVTQSRDSLRIWRHRTTSDQENDWRYMTFARAELQHVAERYLDRPWLHCREIDWLIVNVLTYAEYQATLDTFRANVMPFTRYFAGKLGTTSSAAWSITWRVLVTGGKWAIWCGLAVVAAIVAAPAGPIALVVVTAGWLFRKWRARNKLNAILAAMLRTYSHLSTVSQGWEALWQELNYSRGQGAVWDGIVYHLVEDRMRTPI
jgi:hypothetical protein